MKRVRVAKYGAARYVYELNDRETIQRFWSKVNAKGTDDCWEWQAHITPFGYGDFTFNRRTYRSSVLAAMICLDRKMVKGECVLHSCDNPACVNPNHLWLGTKKDNTRDMLAKGRHKCSHSRKPIPDAVVIEIRKLREENKKVYTIQKLVEMFGISHTYVLDIVHHKTRKKISG